MIKIDPGVLANTPSGVMILIRAELWHYAWEKVREGWKEGGEREGGREGG